MSNTDKFGQGYFHERRQNPDALFRGKDLSFLKYPFWSRTIRKYARCGKLLDIGCGEGAFLKWAERRGYDTYGIDISRFAINVLSRQKTGRTELLIADVKSLPFVDNCFDVVTCFDVLEHLDQPQVGLEEVSRCLKKGGMFIMSVPNVHSHGLRWKGNNWFGYRDSTHVSLFPTVEWENLLRESGFELASRFYDTLWDSPYFKHIPTIMQHIIFKPLLLLLYWTPIRFPNRWGENLYLILRRKEFGKEVIAKSPE